MDSREALANFLDGAIKATTEQDGIVVSIPLSVAREARDLLRNGASLEAALRRMVKAHQETSTDSEGEWPQADSGCIDCTVGTVPNHLNTGRCAYHAAKELLA